MTRAIFHPADDGLLNYLEEEGMSIEPEYFLPTVPMVLINGADGIGTGELTTSRRCRQLTTRMVYSDSQLQPPRDCRESASFDEGRGG
jgi:hypothetical protein